MAPRPPLSSASTLYPPLSTLFSSLSHFRCPRLLLSAFSSSSVFLAMALALAMAKAKAGLGCEECPQVRSEGLLVCFFFLLVLGVGSPGSETFSQLPGFNDLRIADESRGRKIYSIQSTLYKC